MKRPCRSGYHKNFIGGAIFAYTSTFRLDGGDLASNRLQKNFSLLLSYQRFIAIVN